MFFLFINTVIIGMMSAGIFLWEGQYWLGGSLLGFSMLFAGGFFRWKKKAAKKSGKKLVKSCCDCGFIPDCDCCDSIPDCDSCDFIPDCDCCDCD